MPRSTPQLAIRHAGLIIFWVGLARIVFALSDLNDDVEFRSYVRRIAMLLYLPLAGASLYVLSRFPNRLMRWARPSFDLKAALVLPQSEVDFSP
jgi:hypothetical protein